MTTIDSVCLSLGLVTWRGDVCTYLSFWTKRVHVRAVFICECVLWKSIDLCVCVCVCENVMKKAIPLIDKTDGQGGAQLRLCATWEAPGQILYVSHISPAELWTEVDLFGFQNFLCSKLLMPAAARHNNTKRVRHCTMWILYWDSILGITPSQSWIFTSTRFLSSGCFPDLLIPQPVHPDPREKPKPNSQEI